MKKVVNVLVGLVAALHLFFMILEMFLWQTDFGLKTFALSPQVAADTATLAKNQGLYNGFLAAGLIWTFFIKNLEFQRANRIFFLLFIVIAGIFGALTAKFSIFFIQSVPALLALIAIKRAK